MFTHADLERQEYGTKNYAKCGDCKKEFLVTPDNEKFCTRCNAMFEVMNDNEYDCDDLDFDTSMNY